MKNSGKRLPTFALARPDSTSAIAVYYYYSARKLHGTEFIIPPAVEG